MRGEILLLGDAKGGTQYTCGTTETCNSRITAGGFGYGAYSNISSIGNHLMGGGGGWYGGGLSWDDGSAGGSGYVNNSKLANAQTISGNQSFPAPTNNSNETGHSGNGYARITPVN